MSRPLIFMVEDLSSFLHTYTIPYYLTVAGGELYIAAFPATAPAGVSRSGVIYILSNR